MNTEIGNGRHKALLFDIGGVIVPLHFPRAFGLMGELCGLPAEELRRRLFAGGLVEQFERGELSAEQFAASACERLDVVLPYERFCSVWCSIFDVQSQIPESLFASLKTRYRLVLLSNTNSIHFAALRSHCKAIPYFHDAILSFQVGAMKPQAAVFEAAVKRAGCRASECFYVDDTEAYVESARGLGIDAVRFESVARLHGELRTRGIL